VSAGALKIMLARSIIYDFACERTVKSWLPLATGGTFRVCVQTRWTLCANQGCAHQTSAAAALPPSRGSFSRAACRLPVIRIIEILIKGAFLRCSLALWLIINHTELSLGYPHCYYVLLCLLGRVCPLIFRMRH
jgi:hypothetical protein